MRVLRAHADGAMQAVELEQELGWASQASIRLAVRNMYDAGALAKVDRTVQPARMAFELTEAGHALLAVNDLLERWLSEAPDVLNLDDEAAAHGIVRALTAAWDSKIIRYLAEQPRSLIELSTEIPEVNYPVLKRRLAKLRSTRLAASNQTNPGGGFVASAWLRRAVALLVLASRWERRYDPDAPTISRVELETMFLLALPLLELSTRVTGTCALAVLSGDEGTAGRGVVSVSVNLEQGDVVSYQIQAGRRLTWALGTVDAWFEALLDGQIGKLRLGGAKPHQAKSIVKSLYDAMLQAA